MKKIIFCALSIPFLGLSQNNVTINSTQETSNLNANSLLQYTFSDTGINSELSEIGATFFKNKFLIISNKKRRHTQTTLNSSTKKFNNNTYCTDVDESGNLSFPLHFSKVLDNNFDEGTMTFSKDEKTIYFAKNSGDNQPFKLYKASFDKQSKGYWENITELKVADAEYSVETPFLNKSDNKLYFSSNMPGGQGGFDIYVADVLEDGTLANIKNLGNKVNTNKDEKYIFVSPNNKYIYFSSNGHQGEGGYDVFRSSIVRNYTFENTVNIGNGFNSEKDEIGLILTSDIQGYVSINKNNNKEDFDIFRFDIIKKDQELKLTIVDNATNIPLPNTEVTIKDEFGNKILNARTDKNGEVALKSVPLTQYSITSTKEGYTTSTSNLVASPVEANVKETIGLSVVGSEKPEPKAPVSLEKVDNIYFDLNKDSIREDSKGTLLYLISILEENPEVKISIAAHTDSRGTQKYNQILSDKRAKSTYNFLVKNGIDKARLSYKGYGGTSPKHDCKVCTELQHQENRRVEFKIEE